MSDVMRDVAEIHRLLKEAYDHYFANSDGYCKPSEGAVSLHWPTYFDMRDGEMEPGCSVYSYVLGPSRNHDFASTADALSAVREWHREEMQTEYDESGDKRHPCSSVLRDGWTGTETKCDLDAGHEGGHRSGDDRAWWTE